MTEPPLDAELEQPIAVLVPLPDKAALAAVYIHLLGKVVAVETDRVACTVAGLPPLYLDGPRRGLWFKRDCFCNVDTDRPEVFISDCIGVWLEVSDG